MPVLAIASQAGTTALTAHELKYLSELDEIWVPSKYVMAGAPCIVQ